MSDRITVSLETVERLVAEQFPQWSHLPVRHVRHSGWDNRSFRLGETMLVRMPSAARYVAQVEKEQVWLPYLAAHLPLAIPEPLACGAPSDDVPWQWSIYRWLDGEPLAAQLSRTNLSLLAMDVGAFLRALYAIDASEGPVAGTHNFHRGGDLRVYDEDVRAAIIALADEVDAELARVVWDLSLQSTWQDKPVWIHGDIAEGNLLMANGRLSAVIDFGCCGVGDPASDLILAWNVLDQESRALFRSEFGFDQATWQRGRGWALWKALITLAAQRNKNEILTEWSRRAIWEVFADHV